MVYIHSKSYSPHFNLALEQYVFDCMDKQQSYCILWQNNRSVVVGKHQKAADEINTAYVKEKDIPVVRRLSGGGAVYYDLGNLCFSFIANISDIEKLSYACLCEPLLQALKHFGIQAQITSQNDIVIGDKKISGNSSYVKNGRAIYHGTILWNADLSVAEKVFCTPAAGNRPLWHITNVCSHMPVPLPLFVFCEVLLKEIREKTSLRPYKLKEKDLKQIEWIKNRRYDMWEWNWGFSPKAI